MRPVPDAIISSDERGDDRERDHADVVGLAGASTRAPRGPGETVCGISRAIRAGAFSAVSFAIAVPVT